MIDFLLKYGSWIWLSVLIICCVIEALTLSLTAIWGAISAIPMIFIAKTSLPFQWQLLIFVVLTIVLIIFTRPFAVKKLKNGSHKTNVDEMIGQDVLVTKTVSQFEKGEAKAKNGIIWRISSRDNKMIPEGAICKIVSVEGNTLIVEGDEKQ